MSELSFELTNESRVLPGGTLYRIRATRNNDYWMINKGDLGGWVSSEYLKDGVTPRISDYAWVFDDARLFGDAFITGYSSISDSAVVCSQASLEDYADVSLNAIVCGSAIVGGHAMISGDVYVSGYARIEGKSQVFGDASVMGNAKVRGNAIVKGSAVVRGDTVVDGSRVVEGWLDNSVEGPYDPEEDAPMVKMTERVRMLEDKVSELTATIQRVRNYAEECGTTSRHLLEVLDDKRPV